jgi:hypothetical protein
MLMDKRTMQDGIVVGLIGYASVAVFYGAFDLLAARGPLYTVDLLGKALFRGLRDPGVVMFPIRPDLTAMSLYNALHLVSALAIGLTVTSLAAYAERQASKSYGVLFVIVAGFVVTILGVGALTQPMRPVLPWWSIVLANSLATAMAGAYLLRQRPGIWRRLLPFTS